MTEPFVLANKPFRAAHRVRRGGWAWGPLETAKLRVLSFGGGVQSSTLVYMMIDGLLPWVDAIIYAETGDDGGVTDAHINVMEGLIRSASNECQFLRVSNGRKLSDDIRRRADNDAGRFVAAPFYAAGGGQARRQCTREFKIEPLEKAQRKLLGYEPRQIIPPGSAEVWIGFSTDEVVRAGAAFARWSVNRFPLLEQRMSRRDCINWINEKGFPMPPRSACVFCPFRTAADWRSLKANDPEGFETACEIDRLLRETNEGRMKEKLYVHRSLKPLSEVDFSTAEEQGQGMLNICEAGCGV
jgi:hypothetical protein